MQKASRVMLFLMVTALSSCSYYEHQTKQLFYNELEGTNDSLDKMTADWHQLLNRAIATKSFAGFAQTRTKMSQFISRNRAKISTIELPPNMEGLKDSEEVFLSGRAAIISDVYPAFEPFNDITPMDEVQGQLKILGNDMEAETTGSAALRKTLQAYAKANGLKLFPAVK